jgi:phage anti-repressor protein
MKVYKIFFNNLKEEAWIQNLAKDGWLIENIGFGYTFRKVEKKQYNLKMDYRIFTKQEDFES